MIALLAMLIIPVGCRSHKGSSSLGSTRRTTTSQSTPSVKSTTSESYGTSANLSAEKDKESKAELAAVEAERIRQETETKVREDAENVAKKAKKDAEAAATKAKTEAEARAKQAAEEKVVVRAEKVKIIETEDKDLPEEEEGRYHIIIGSFKQLENARQLCQDAIRKDFLPSIMENENGQYRVSIYSCSLEKTARNKIADIRLKFPEYVGTWLLIEKK